VSNNIAVSTWPSLQNFPNGASYMKNCLLHSQVETVE